MADSESPFKYLDVAGVSTEYLARGQGRPILYLHGGEGIEIDLPFIDALARHGQVYAPSHPGFGGSDLPGRFSTVDDLAYHYLDFLEALDLRDCVVMGASFGGWIAAEIAIKASPRLAGLVLIDAVGIKISPPDKRDIVDLFVLSPEEQRDFLYHAPLPPVQPTTMDAAVRIARNRETFSLYGWSPTLYNPKLFGRLRRISVPTAVLWGVEDRVASPDYGRAYAQAIPGATFKLVAKSGHYPQVEQMQATVAEVSRFLTQVGAPMGVVA